MKKLVTFFILCPFLLLLSANGAELSYELGFSPNGESLQIVLNGIADAKESVLVAAYSFTSRPVSEALLAAHKRGVKVAVVADHKGNSSRYTAVNYLANHGVPVRLNGNYAIMHHKFMIIDGLSVQLGSFNYSSAAVDKNAENVLLIKGVHCMASKYTAEWNRLWAEGTDVKKNY